MHHGRARSRRALRVGRWEPSRELGAHGVGFVLYAMLDVVVDGYFETIDRFEAFYDEVADRVFAESPIEPSAHRQWFEMRKALNTFDRILGPLAEAVAHDRRPGPRPASRTTPRRTCATSPAR